MRRTPSNELRQLQGYPAKKSAGDSRLDPWLFGVLTDCRLSRRVRAAALVLRDSYDLQSGFTSPTIRTIASIAGISRGAAERAVKRLAATGHLRIDRGCGGVGNSNIYKVPRT